MIDGMPSLFSHDVKSYGLASVSRIDKKEPYTRDNIIFCKRDLLYSVKETYILIDPNKFNRSHPIARNDASSRLGCSLRIVITCYDFAPCRIHCSANVDHSCESRVFIEN